MLEDVIILKSDGTPLKKCARSKADWMLRVGVARVYQAADPMKIILKAPEGLESEEEVLKRVRPHKKPIDTRKSGVEMGVSLLQSDGQFLKKVTEGTASWLLKVGVARVYSTEPYMLIMKAPPAAEQTVVAQTPPSGLSTGEAKEQYPRPRNRLYPIKLLWPNYTPKKETV